MTPDVFAIGLVSTAVLAVGRVVLRKELLAQAERLDRRDRRAVDHLEQLVAELQRELEEEREANRAHGAQIVMLTHHIEALTDGGPYRSAGGR